MIETKDLVLDKAKFSDWEDMYKNVWSHPESARYMSWKVIKNEEDAKVRILKTIETQKTHDTYLVYEKASGQAIGFAGVFQMEPSVYGETGICLGPDYTGKGYGKQIVEGLMDYCREKLHAKTFVYASRSENQASIRLALRLGFTQTAAQELIDGDTGKTYLKYIYQRTL
ncbi:MAG TPA: GNAT family N-acetyltransferase [Candidatus Scybalocola faecigallinarum]|uniref:GNAT family N-acetyltransferase n=1 Tax=Candidatus Scybalocola faecigallinarum TaxID=2840941 RepID=A0A9D1F6N4_9FIRM|nr:GNAT family N-acetyltransferase [Candidatus Scybalocola faecigallinarum]